MKTLLHIGMSKTGSTALQQSFMQSRAALLRRGVLYPENPPKARHYSHRILLAGVVGANRLSPRLIERNPPDVARRLCIRFLAGIRERTEASAPGCLVLSTEAFFRSLRDEEGTRLRAMLGERADDLAVIAYLRRPSEHYASRLQQALRTTYVIPAPSAPGYRKVLSTFETLFGKSALSLHLFSRAVLVGGDVVADFATKHLAPWGVAPEDLEAPRSGNISLSGEAADVLRRFRREFNADREQRQTPESQALVAALRDADAASGAGRLRLRPVVADTVDYSRPDPLWLRDRYGIAFADFDYSRIPATRVAIPPAPAALEDVVEIDRPTERAILADLRLRPWAADADRRAWIDRLLAALR